MCPAFFILWRSLVVGLAIFADLACRADVAVLHEKGPWSGSVFSNPGLVDGAPPETKITMQSAKVHIQLSRGHAGSLVATCAAEFEMENLSDAKAKPEAILVAFPVTGLNSKIVTISGFTVVVDGQKPAIVLRRAVTISKWKSELRDTPVFGQLEARFAADDNKSGWGIPVGDSRIYRDCYIWAQSFRPATLTHITVTYSAELRPQSIHYSKAYGREDTDGEVIPFSDIDVDRWQDAYYFFDYILISGSTWNGPIGHETIDMGVDSDLGLSPYQIHGSMRHPSGYNPKRSEPERMSGMLSERRAKDGAPEWDLRGKPGYDLLISIPNSALHIEQTKPPK
jgi:hypothetical protein